MGEFPINIVQHDKDMTEKATGDKMNGPWTVENGKESCQHRD